MSEVKNKKKKSTIIQVSIGVLAFIMAILIIIMMRIVSDIQGTARIVNYTGLVRGETQRIIKLEVAGEQDDAMIQEVRSFIGGLRDGNTKLNLVYLNDKDVAFFCEYFSARPVASSQITKKSSLLDIISVFSYPSDLPKQISLYRPEKPSSSSCILF